MRKKIMVTVAAFMVTILAGIGIWFQIALADTNEDAILEGIYIDGVAVGGCTKEEAVSKLENEINAQKGVAITLKVGEKKVESILGEIGYSVNVDEAVETAVSYGKKGNIIKCYKEKKDLQQQEYQIKTTKNLNEVTFGQFIEEKKDDLVKKATNAGLKKVGGSFQIIPEQMGETIDKKESQSKLISFLNESFQKEAVEFDLVVTEEAPKHSSEDLARVKDVIGEFTTSFATSSASRANNVSNAAGLINGTLVYPGEEFSTYDVIGPVVQSNGYSMAGSYSNGEVVESVGGGICQVSSTLYNAVLRAELEVTERAPHSMVVSYVQYAADAAISGTYKNFKFKNNTDVPIYVEGVVNNRQLTFRIYGEETRDPNRTIEFKNEIISTIAPGKDIEKEDPTLQEGKRIVTQSAHVGYQVKLWKYIYVGGVLQEKVLVNTSTYQASPRRVTVGTKKDEKKEDKDNQNNSEDKKNPDKDTNNNKKPTPEKENEKPKKDAEEEKEESLNEN